MRVPINLAREPFRRDRPVLIASAIGCMILTVTLIFLSSAALSERAEAQKTRVTLNAVNRQLTRMQAEQTKLETAMRQPANSVVLDRSLLFNDIIRRKSISWTRIFSDLETVLPHDVRISAIHPQVNSKDDLSLDMTVEATAPEPVIGFVARLEGSDVFGSTQVSTITLPTQNDPFYRYRLSVTYTQKLCGTGASACPSPSPVGQISDLPANRPSLRQVAALPIAQTVVPTPVVQPQVVQPQVVQPQVVQPQVVQPQAQPVNNPNPAPPPPPPSGPIRGPRSMGHLPPPPTIQPGVTNAP
jgi:hypothetical protein